MEAESRGNLCLEKHDFINAVMKLLNAEYLTEDMVANRALKLVNDRKLECYMGNVYRNKTAYAEKHLAYMIVNQLNTSKKPNIRDIETELDLFEVHRNIKMADEQRKAVHTALTSGVSIITGGPGTGKTMIQRAILEIYKKHNPYKQICCCAPTGRAARRMFQSTGNEANTVHKVLNLKANDPEVIFGDIDAMKLKSSMTLFSLVSEEDSVFHKVLKKFFNGQIDITVNFFGFHLFDESKHKNNRAFSSSGTINFKR